MRFADAERIADALLYEGYLLYPYRLSSVKNVRRWTFGCLFPPVYPQPPGSAEGPSLQAEVLVITGADARVAVKARFLHLAGDEGIPREVPSPELSLEATSHAVPWAFAGPGHEAIAGTLDVSAEALAEGLLRLRVRLENRTTAEGIGQLTREAALAWSVVACHLIVAVEGGEFVSPTDPPEALRAAAAGCRSERTWPVLVGPPGRRDLLLAAPIILGDYPEVAGQSPGDLFDGTEIDELLTLRIRTLTPAEKEEMATSDPRAAAVLARCEALGDDQFLGLHGAWRPAEAPAVHVGGVLLAPGVRVRLRPRRSADALDLALAGRTAVVVSIDQDFEDRVHVGVALDDDPGQDLGVAGRPAHRFFFAPEEVEPLPPGGEP
jgi:hypothetical protein